MSKSLYELTGELRASVEEAKREHVAKAERVQNVVDAIEAFVLARIAFDKSPTVMRRTDVNETREHMRDKLGELLS